MGNVRNWKKDVWERDHDWDNWGRMSVIIAIYQSQIMVLTCYSWTSPHPTHYPFLIPN